MVLELLKLNIFSNFEKRIFQKGTFLLMVMNIIHYGKVVNCSNINFKEVPVSMDYPSTGQYTKIRPILDWYIIAKFWIKGILSKNQL